MTVMKAGDAAAHTTHGCTFRSYVSPSRGSQDLCAWRLSVPPASRGVAHRPDREEVLLALSGDPTLTIDGAPSVLEPGDVALVPAGAELVVDGGTDDAELWVTTTPGLRAELADGTVLAPPWAR